MKGWHLPLIVFEGALALLVTFCTLDRQTQYGTVAGTARGTLIVLDDDGHTTHAHMIRPSAQITRDGVAAELKDVQVGDKVSVTLHPEEGLAIVDRVSAQASASRLDRQSAEVAEPVASVATFD